MTVSSTTNKATYSGNGTTTVFTVPFYFLEAADLQVILRSGATETVQTLTTQYTVTGAGVPSGGTVTMLTAPASGTTLTILRNVSPTQETDLLPNDRLPAESLETALDKATMLIQQLEEEVGRSLKYPASDAAMSAQLPTSSSRAGKYLGFDSSGFPTVSSSSPTPYLASSVSFLPSGTGATLRSVNDKLRETLSVKDFGAVGDGVVDDTQAIQAAIAASSASGQWLLWNAGTYRFVLAQTWTVPVVRWVTEGAVLLIDTSVDVDVGVQINIGDNAQHQILGQGFEVNGNGKTNIGLRFTQALGTSTANFYAEKLVARNCEKRIGASGAAGIEIRGGFGRVTLIEPEAHRMMIRTGAGTPGSAGIVGILVQNQPAVSGAYCRNLEIIRPKVRRVYSADASYVYDMDGIGVFANPDVVGGNSYAKIVEPDCEGCWGRDIKSQFARCEIINPRSVVNEGPTPLKIFPSFDFQSGPGLLLGGSVLVDGVAASSVVQYATSTAFGPCSHVTEGGTVAIVNGGSLTRFAIHDAAPVVKMVSRTKGISVNGSIQEFAYVRTNGADIDYCFVEGVTATLTDALIRVESSGGGVSPYIANVFARGCVNLGSAVATLRANVPGQAAQAVLSQEDLFGFVAPNRVYLTTQTTTTGGVVQGLRRPEAGNPSVGRSVGGERFLSVELANNAEFLLPEWGFDLSCIVEIKASTNDRNGYAILSFDTGGFTNISVGSNFNIGTTSDPGSGSYRVWRDGNQIRLKNAQGSTRFFTILMRG